MAMIYHKSELGTAAMKDRHLLHDPKLRSVLILVDGKRPHSELLKMGSGLGDPAPVIAELLRLGMIEATMPVSMPVPTAAPLAQARAQPVAAPKAPPMPDLRLRAAREVTALLGPNGEALALRIEQAKTDEGFIASLRQAAESINNLRGRTVAMNFYNGIVSAIPGQQTL